MNPLRIIALLILAGVLATAAVAHDTWLIPQRFSVMQNAAVQLDLTSGMAFPVLETSIKRERIDRARCRLAEDAFDLTDISPAPKSLRFQALLLKVGIATCWVELKPRTLELKPKQVEEYLDEIGAPAAVRKEWASMKEPRRWRELYTKHAKTFLGVGPMIEDLAWSEPVGMSLEIVPETDPTRLRHGKDLRVRVLENGEPLPNFPLGLVHEGGRHGQIRITDSQGRVRFGVVRSGRFLLRGTKLRKSAQPEVDWESDFTTLTVNVK